MINPDRKPPTWAALPILGLVMPNSRLNAMNLLGGGGGGVVEELPYLGLGASPKSLGWSCLTSGCSGVGVGGGKVQWNPACCDEAAHRPALFTLSTDPPTVPTCACMPCPQR